MQISISLCGFRSGVFFLVTATIQSLTPPGILQILTCENILVPICSFAVLEAVKIVFHHHLSKCSGLTRGVVAGEGKKRAPVFCRFEDYAISVCGQKNTSRCGGSCCSSKVAEYTKLTTIPVALNPRQISGRSPSCFLAYDTQEWIEFFSTSVKPVPDICG